MSPPQARRALFERNEHRVGNCCGPGVESCGLRCREPSGVKRGTRELAAGTVLGSNYAPGVADADRADDAAEDHESTRHADAEAERRERGLVGCGNDRRRLAAWYPGDEEPAERQALHLRDGGSSGCGQRLVGEIAIERLLNCAATSAPTATVAIKPATRATALFAPEPQR